MEPLFASFIRDVHRSKLGDTTKLGLKRTKSLVAVHWPLFWDTYAPYGLARAFGLAPSASWRDARTVAGPGQQGQDAVALGGALAKTLGADLTEVSVYSPKGDSVPLLYPNRIPPHVRLLAEAVNEGHDPARGVFVVGNAVIVNWVVRAVILGIEAEHWRLTQSVAGVPNVAMRWKDRALRLLAVSPWPNAHAATTVSIVDKLAKAVKFLERGITLHAPKPVRPSSIIAEDVDPLAPGLEPGDWVAFREAFPDGCRVVLSALKTALRSTVPQGVILRGGLPHSSKLAQLNLRAYDCGRSPVIHHETCVLWTAQALRALARAGASNPGTLRMVAAYLDQNRAAPKLALPPAPPRDDVTKVAWTPAEDALLLRFFDLDDKTRRPSAEDWEFLLSRLAEPHRERARARARACYLRKRAVLVAPVVR